MNTYVLVAFDFNANNIPLQPWKYLFEFARHLNKKGRVYIITNGQHKEVGIDGITICSIPRISPGQSGNIEERIKSFGACEVYWWASPRTYFYKTLFENIGHKVNLLFTGPVYHKSEVIPVLPFIGNAQLRTYVPNIFTPDILTRWLVNARCIGKVITLSNRNKQRLIAMGCRKEKIVVTGIGKDVTGIEKDMARIARNPHRLLYITSATKIRGIEMLLRVFARLIKCYPSLELRILARPSNGNNTNMVRALCRRYKLGKHVEIVEGWLSKTEILQQLAMCRALVMPFLLVHSDMPVSILEAFSVGTPVIAPDLDGITELIKNRGLPYIHYKPQSLQAAIELLLNNDELHEEYSRQALVFWKERPYWSELFDQVSI
jgi:glycosyltransferase involved in cell wall biosynthesis